MPFPLSLAVVHWRYDRFGRRTRDGELTTTYDANGNVATMTYPGGVEATYGYGLVGDRPVSVSVDTGAGPQPVVSGGTYLPAGPLTGLTFGNGATETRDRSGTPETDTYEPNAGSGSSPRLDEIQLSPTGNADYGWDDAGNLETLERGANHLAFTFDAAGRLSEIERGDEMSVDDSAVFLYDGRGFLRSATDPATGATVEPLYDSSGRLHALVEKDTPTSPERRHTLVYLAGRPVAQLTRQDGTESWQYLTNHLGSAVLREGTP